MIINGTPLLVRSPIANMLPSKQPAPGGTSCGLGEAGYDICIAEKIKFQRAPDGRRIWGRIDADGGCYHGLGNFCLASASDKFQMPDDLVGIVHDKSTWARQGLSVFNTVIEPGWHGFLTLELVYHGDGELIIPAGAGIAQVVFHQTAFRTEYSGKYQNQEAGPQKARFA